MASSGHDGKVKIFDKRKLEAVITFGGIHNSNIFSFVNNKLFLTSNSYLIGVVACVRWSPSGDWLASASWDSKVALLDFKTEKNLYVEKTPKGGKFATFNPINIIHIEP